MSLLDALMFKYPGKEFGIEGEDTIILWPTDLPTPDAEFLVSVLGEYTESIHWSSLRTERDTRLTATDWRFRSDQTPSQAWIDYCQQLRDLPANTVDPANPVWPIEPI